MVKSVAWRPLAVVAAVLALVLLAFSTRYGYHRDELYFLACGRHPAWGYPDQPPLTPMLAALMNALGHGSLLVFRLPSVLSVTGSTLLAGLIARELGGDRFAQVLAAVATATGLFVLLAGHFLVTSSIDLVIWVTLIWLVVRIVRTGAERLWLAVGVVAGIGLLNKQLILALLLGLAVGLALTPDQRRWLTSRWLWAGAVLALAAWAPVLVWQARHGWPQLTIASEIRAEYGTFDERIGFVVGQFFLISLGASVLWILFLAALARLWRDPARRQFWLLAWAWLVVLAAFMLTGGQVYYPIGLYPALIAAGAVVVERHRRARWVTLGAVLATSAMFLPVALPILSPAALGDSGWSDLAEIQRETVGWPHLVDVVSAAYQTIPFEQRAQAQIFAVNYGEAGAVDRFGPARGLPHAWSGHNGYALWGPPPSSPAPVVVVWEDGPPTDFFTDCRHFAKITGPVDNEERKRASVYVCAGPIGGWAADWPRLSHLSS